MKRQGAWFQTWGWNFEGKRAAGFEAFADQCSRAPAGLAYTVAQGRGVS